MNKNHTKNKKIEKRYKKKFVNIAKKYQWKRKRGQNMISSKCTSKDLAHHLAFSSGCQIESYSVGKSLIMKVICRMITAKFPLTSTFQ